MALSGSFSGGIWSNHYRLRIDWTATQSVANNTSTITAKAYLVLDSAYSISIGSRSNTITIAGQEGSYSSGGIEKKGGETYLGSVTKTVTHAADGTKSITMSSVFNIQATLGGTYYSKIEASSGTITLDTIPRASSVSCPAATAGSAVTVSISRASSSFTHTLEAYVGNTKIETIGTGIATSKSWTPDIATYAAKATSATSVTVTIKCITYNGTTNIGSKTVNVTVSIPASVKPTCSLAIEAVDPKWGLYIQNKSKAKLTPTGAGIYGSTISSWSLKQGNTVISSSSGAFTTDLLSVSGSVTFTLTVTDTRNRTASASQTITVTPYSSPKISNILSQRVEGDEQHAVVTFSQAIASCGGNNSAAVTIEWTGQTALPAVSGQTYGLFDIATTFTLKLTITDAFETQSFEDTLSTVFSLINYRKFGKGLAFGKVSEKDALEVNMDAEFLKPVSFGIGNDTLADYVVDEGTSGIWSYRKWASGKAEMWGKASQQVTTSAWGNIFDVNFTGFSENFPFAFIAAPIAVANATGSYAFMVSRIDLNTQAITNMVLARATNVADKQVTVLVYLIGTWK